MPLRYDHPTAIVRHSQSFVNPVGASYIGNYFYPWAKCALINVHGQVTITGTGTTVNSPIVYKLVGTATTALGTLVLSTNINGVTKNMAGSAGTPLATLASGDLVCGLVWGRFLCAQSANGCWQLAFGLLVCSAG